LGRLRATRARAALTEALDDPIFDVRRAAVTALEQLDLPPRIGRFGRTDAYEPEPAAESDDDSPWKAKLRGLLPEEDA
jgi:hypothetical protein